MALCISSGIISESPDNSFEKALSTPLTHSCAHVPTSDRVRANSFSLATVKIKSFQINLGAWGFWKLELCGLSCTVYRILEIPN